MHSVSLFHEAAQKFRAASDELAESQVSVKRAQLPYFHAAGACIALRSCVSLRAKLAHVCRKQVNLILDEEGILPFRPDRYFAKCFWPVLLAFASAPPSCP